MKETPKTVTTEKENKQRRTVNSRNMSFVSNRKVPKGNYRNMFACLIFYFTSDKLNRVNRYISPSKH